MSSGIAGSSASTPNLLYDGNWSSGVGADTSTNPKQWAVINGGAVSIYEEAMYWNISSSSSTTYTGILNNTPTLLGNVTGLTAGDNWSCSAQAISTTNTSVWNTSANVTVTGAPDLNCTLQTGIYSVIFQPVLALPCPATANNVYPVNQSSPNGLYLCTNNGTGSGTLQAKTNQTDTGIIKVVSTDYFVTQNITLTTNYQDLKTLAAGASTNVSRYNNYSTCLIPLSNTTFYIRT
jgi:hypothetical protein